MTNMNAHTRFRKWMAVAMVPICITFWILFPGCGSGNPYMDAGAEAHSDALVVVNDDNFTAKVLESEFPVMVDFWATWCGPCLQMAPLVSKLADAYDGKAVVAKMDVDRSSAIPRKYGITAIPTFIVFHHGKEVARYEGMTSYNGLASMLEKPMGTASQTPAPGPIPETPSSN